MADFLESLKGIKNELIKEQKNKENIVKKPVQNPNKDEFKEIFKEPESPKDKQIRLRDEFIDFIKYNDVKKID